MRGTSQRTIRQSATYTDRINQAQSSLLLSVQKAEKELVLSLAEILHKLNEISRQNNLNCAYRLHVNSPSDAVCHLYENDTFVRVLSVAAAERRLKDALAKHRLKSQPVPAPHLQLTPDEIKRRQAKMREALLATLTLSAKLKEQLGILTQTKKFSPFVVE